MCLIVVFVLCLALAPCAESAPLKIDFQPESSKLEAGWEPLTPAMLSDDSRAYGWLASPELARDREKGSALTRDLIADTAPRTLRLRLGNGPHTVTAHIGDRGAYAHDAIQIFSGTTPLTPPISTKEGEMQQVRFGVDVKGGALDLTFADTGGSDEYWVCAGLEIAEGQYDGPAFVPEPTPPLEVRELELGADGQYSPDGAWCWFGDPRAVYHEGAYYVGWISQNGSIVVSRWESDSRSIRAVTLHVKYQKDDHDNPSLYFRRDGKLLVFYSKHGGPEMNARLCDKPETLEGWGPEQTLPIRLKRDRWGITYPNPIRLSAEDNKLFLFWRGAEWKPNWAVSLDDGDTWEPKGIVLKRRTNSDANRPYVKVFGNGVDTIHMIFTDGHPRNEPANSVYYAKYRDGAWRRADDTVIATLDAMPFDPDKADEIFDGGAMGARGWVWEIALDAAGRPVVVYAACPTEERHTYRYARWNGSEWFETELTEAGPWFPMTPPGKREREPHYSGGVALDPVDPSIVYLSRKVGEQFEIECWRSDDGGKTWDRSGITSGSDTRNVRPFVARNHPAGESGLFWMRGDYIHYTNYQTGIWTDMRAR